MISNQGISNGQNVANAKTFESIHKYHGSISTWTKNNLKIDILDELGIFKKCVGWGCSSGGRVLSYYVQGPRSNS
jgi:hypothetical protein